MSSQEDFTITEEVTRSLDHVESLDTASKDLIRDWLSSTARGRETDVLVSLFEFSRSRLFARDGFVASGVQSRRASLDPAKDDVIREIAKGLREKKCEFVSSFIKEWIDTSDDPHGMILDHSSTQSLNLSISSPSVTSSVQPDDGMMDKLLSWENDFLSFSQSELVNRSIKVFQCWGFWDNRPLVDRTKFNGFVRLIAKNYRSENPYHNFHHAHSVLAIVGNLLRKTARGLFSDMEEFAILTAAMCHDVGHRGLNSDYYVKSRHSLAVQYNDISVLENMHCSLTFDLLRSNESVDFTKDWSDEQYVQFRRVFIQSVLATDMKVHFDLTTGVQKLAGLEDLSSGENKKLVFQSIVHAADLANPVMPTKASYQWAFRVVEEMYEQGRLEEQDGFIVAPFMKHPPTETVEFAKLQTSFVEFIVAPLWKSMALVWPCLQDRIDQLEKNMKFWESLRDHPDKQKSE